MKKSANGDAAGLRTRLGLIEEHELFGLLKISSGTGRNRQSAGKLPPHYKVGATKFYELAEVQAWMRRQRRGGPR